MKAFREMVLRAWDLCVNDIVFILNTSSIFPWITAEITMPQIFYKRDDFRRDQLFAFQIKWLTEFKLNFGNQAATYHMGRTRADIAIKRRGESSLRTKVFIYLFIFTRIH